jgi:hypothetical protein
MNREHFSPARGSVRTGLGAIALAAALAMATSACQSTSKASVVGQDATTSSAAAVGAPSTSGSAAAKTSAAASSSAAAASGTFKVGQQVKVGSYTVTVHKVTYPYTSDMDTPEAGKAYILLDVEVANNTSSKQTFSSLMQFGLKDSTNVSYTETIAVGADGQVPDGDIPAGQSLRGPVAFQVPAGAKGLQFSFVSDLINGDKTYIDLGK